jgi:hypothetical protein
MLASPGSLPPSLDAMLGLPERKDPPRRRILVLRALSGYLLTLDISPRRTTLCKYPRASPVEANAICSRVLCCVGREKPPEGSQVDSYPLS